MFEVGTLCVKIAGRDAGKQCAVVEVLDQQHVLIDGETRRRKVNVKHLEPLPKTIDISKGASHEDVTKAFDLLGVKIVDTKPRQKAARPKKVRKQKVKAPVKKVAQKKVKKKETLEAAIEPK